MPILVIREPAAAGEIAEMLAELGLFIKLAVDVARDLLAGGGALHADCEQALLEDGSRQEDVWGADWYPDIREVGFESLINVRPAQANTRLEIQSPEVRRSVELIVRRLLELPR
ncbi:MAG: DUF5674 family protein [Candidatus Rokuibacteriota bacterium]